MLTYCTEALMILALKQEDHAQWEDIATSCFDVDELPRNIFTSYSQPPKNLSELVHHSVFVCPVTKETASEENPPIMLPCFHVYCRDTLKDVPHHNGYDVRSTK